MWGKEGAWLLGPSLRVELSIILGRQSEVKRREPGWGPGHPSSP